MKPRLFFINFLAIHHDGGLASRAAIAQYLQQPVGTANPWTDDTNGCALLIRRASNVVV